MVRTLAGTGTQERVDFSLDVEHLFGLCQALLESDILLAQSRYLDTLRIRFRTAFDT